MAPPLGMVKVNLADGVLEVWLGPADNILIGPGSAGAIRIRNERDGHAVLIFGKLRQTGQRLARPCVRVYINRDPEPVYLQGHQWTELRLRWQHEQRIVTIAYQENEPPGSSESDRWLLVTVTPPPDRPWMARWRCRACRGARSGAHESMRQVRGRPNHSLIDLVIRVCWPDARR